MRKNYRRSLSQLHRSFSRRLTPPLSGETLKQLRVSEDLKQDDIALWYGAKGVTVARICQIEQSQLVNKAIESRFRAAVAVALLLKRQPLGRPKIGLDFANLKRDPAVGR